MPTQPASAPAPVANLDHLWTLLGSVHDQLREVLDQLVAANRKVSEQVRLAQDPSLNPEILRQALGLVDDASTKALIARRRVLDLRQRTLF